MGSSMHEAIEELEWAFAKHDWKLRPYRASLAGMATGVLDTECGPITVNVTKGSGQYVADATRGDDHKRASSLDATDAVAKAVGYLVIR